MFIYVQFRADLHSAIKACFDSISKYPKSQHNIIKLRVTDLLLSGVKGVKEAHSNSNGAGHGRQGEFSLYSGPLIFKRSNKHQVYESTLSSSSFTREEPSFENGYTRLTTKKRCQNDIDQWPTKHWENAVSEFDELFREYVKNQELFTLLQNIRNAVFSSDGIPLVANGRSALSSRESSSGGGSRIRIVDHKDRQTPGLEKESSGFSQISSPSSDHNEPKPKPKPDPKDKEEQKPKSGLLDEQDKLLDSQIDEKGSNNEQKKSEHEEENSIPGNLNNGDPDPNAVGNENEKKEKIDNRIKHLEEKYEGLVVARSLVEAEDALVRALPADRFTQLVQQIYDTTAKYYQVISMVKLNDNPQKTLRDKVNENKQAIDKELSEWEVQRNNLMSALKAENSLTAHVVNAYDEATSVIAFEKEGEDFCLLWLTPVSFSPILVKQFPYSLQERVWVLPQGADPALINTTKQLKIELNQHFQYLFYLASRHPDQVTNYVDTRINPFIAKLSKSYRYVDHSKLVYWNKLSGALFVTVLLAVASALFLAFSFMGSPMAINMGTFVGVQLKLLLSSFEPIANFVMSLDPLGLTQRIAANLALIGLIGAAPYLSKLRREARDAAKDNFTFNEQTQEMKTAVELIKINEVRKETDLDAGKSFYCVSPSVSNG